MRLHEFIRSKRTVITVGSGGVGKTTAAAALGLWAATEGRRALVLTVDPARRLASSLGIDALSEGRRRIDDAVLRHAGLRVSGTLDAAMLDTKSTFDRVIERYAPNPETRRRILDNRFYRQAASTLAGSQEYMAMEKLYEILEESPDEQDLIVLDTPPSQHALDFLSAPSRMLGMMDSAAFRAFVRSIKAFGKVRGQLNRLIFRGVGRFLGVGVFLEIIEFLESFSSMYDGFVERSRRVERLLRQDDLTFLVVTSPEWTSVDEALFLRRTLLERGMPFGAFVVNRGHLPFIEEDDLDAIHARLERAMLDEPTLGLTSRATIRRTASRVMKTYKGMRHLVEKDARSLEMLRKEAGEDAVFVVPHFAEDIHDLGGLYRFASVLAGGSGSSLSAAASSPCSFSPPSVSAGRHT